MEWWVWEVVVIESLPENNTIVSIWLWHGNLYEVGIVPVVE